MTEATAQAEMPVEVLLGRLQAPVPPAEFGPAVDTALARCRVLYGKARSREALPLAKAALSESRRVGDHGRILRAAAACGLLSADMADLVGAVEYHVQALRLAAGDENREEMSRSWNNLGYTLRISGNVAMARRCFERSVALVEPRSEPVYSRYSACLNLADCAFHDGRIEEGIGFAERALREMTPEFHAHDPYGAMLLRRNLVRLYVAAGRMDDAGREVAAAVELAGSDPSPRARIAADITRATYELASGHADVALTRLDQVLARAREAPATLRDTLTCVIRAEEAAGNAARALIRLEELSDHIYGLAIERAREHLELAALRDGAPSPDVHAEQDKARLVAQLAPRAAPEGWNTLQRLSVSAVLRMDESGWHGQRVGALTKALALASGCGPLQALQLGLAAELHDIGMLSVPEGILAKRGDLNDAEKAIVRRHHEAGAEMLRDDGHPMVLLAREIAKYHHAHWDGQGYPERVAGRVIPLGARMCAVADAYDMMVCGFGHRPSRDMGAALEELKRGAGSQFDPELVSCFDALIRSESEGRGLDIDASAGMQDFQELVASLKEDRGFV